MSNSNEIAQIEQIYKALTALNQTINSTATGYLALVKAIESSSGSVKEQISSFSKLASAQRETIKHTVEMDALGKQVMASQAKLKQLEDSRIQTLIETKIKTQEATKAITDKIKASEAEEGSLVRMKQKLAELETAYLKMSKEAREKAAPAIDALSREIGKAEEATNRHQRGVGGYMDQLGSLSKGLTNGTVTVGQFATGFMQAGKAMLAFFLTPVGMIVGAIGGLVIAGRALINNAKDFQKAASELSALTGAVGDDLDFMKKKAIEFSKESTVSATEVVKAFTRVGSAAPFLLKHKELLTEVTESSIILSEATQGKLSLEDAALATTAALNQFNIPLTDSSRAINSLAAGSLLGSVRINDLTESFRNGGAMMNASNMTLEQSIAALELFGEKNIKGSNAGTMLKTVLMQLRSEGMGFASGQFNINDALEETKKKLESIKDPMQRASAEQELFGKRGITGGLILMANTERFKNLSVEIDGYVKKGTIAKDQAKVQDDNLTGSYELLKNAWHGLMLMAEDGNGILMKFWKGIVDSAAWVLRDIGETFNKLGKILDWFRSKESIAAREEKKAAEDKAVSDKAAADKAIKLAEDKAAMEENIRIKKAESEEKEAAKAQKIREKQFQIIETFNSHEINIAKERHIQGITSEEQYNAEIEKLEIELLTKKLGIYKKGSKEYEDTQGQINDKTIKSQDDILKSIEDRFKQQKAIEEEGAKVLEDLLKDRTSAEEKAADEAIKTGERLAGEKKKIDEKTTEDEKKRAKDLKDAKIELAIEVGNAIFDLRNQGFENELSTLEKEKNAKLSNKNLTEAQKAKIDEEFEKKANAIKAKQAKSDKLQALFNIAMSTFQGVMAASAIPPLFAANPMIPFIIAMGGIQAALVAAQPIPKFAKGTQFAPEKGIFGEAGRELMFTQAGETLLAEKPTYFEGGKFKGAKIYSNPETERLIKVMDHHSVGGRGMTDERIFAGLSNLTNATNRVEKAILSKPVAIYDQDHRVIGQKMGTHQEYYLNRLINHN